MYSVLTSTLEASVQLGKIIRLFSPIIASYRPWNGSINQSNLIDFIIGIIAAGLSKTLYIYLFGTTATLTADRISFQRNHP